MTTTARISATTGTGSYDASIAAGSVTNFAASNLSTGERILILKKDSTGGYDALNYLGPDGIQRTAELTQGKNIESITGPLDIRIKKDNTANSVEVVEYS